MSLGYMHKLYLTSWSRVLLEKLTAGYEIPSIFMEPGPAKSEAVVTSWFLYGHDLLSFWHTHVQQRTQVQTNEINKIK
jgi:hypothetical protein